MADKNLQQWFALSSMYSDKLLTEFLPVVKNRAYSRYLEIQQNIFNTIIYKGALADFEENIEMTNVYKLPVGTRYFRLENFTLPIANKQKFIQTFGYYTKPIYLKDIMMNYDIFDRGFYLLINEMYFDQFCFIRDKYHNYFLVFPNSNSSGMSTTTFNRLKADGTFILWRETPSAVYSRSGTIAGMVSDGSSSSKKRISIPRSGAMTKLPLPKDNNSWNIFMTTNTTNYQTHLQTGTIGALHSITATNIIFEVDAKFITKISEKNTSVKVVAVHKPNRKISYVYSASVAQEPVLYLNSEGNPIPGSNICAYEYDENTSCIGKPVFISNMVNPTYFPGIYDMTQYIDKENPKSLLIDIVDYSKEITNTPFDNHLKFFIEKVITPQEYVNFLLYQFSEYTPITTYNPINIHMDYIDFINSDMSDDLRAYKFSKLMELIRSDSYLYKEYVQFMDKLNYGWIFESGTPRYFNFDLDKQSAAIHDEFKVSSARKVMDNSFIAIPKHDNTVFFSEPHSYIKVHCENPDAYVRVFIGGMLVTPTLVDSYLNDIYVFIPIKTADSLLQAYHTEYKDAFTTAEILYDCQLICVELYPNVTRSNANTLYDMLNYTSLEEVKKIFEGRDDLIITLNDLVFYNANTGEYISIDNFDIGFILSEADLKFNDGIVQHIIGSEDDIQYLYTNANELYMTMDKISIILSSNKIETFPEYKPDGDRSMGDLTSILDIINKKWKVTDLLFKLKNPKLLGVDIGVAISSTVREWDINGSHFIPNTEVNPEYYYVTFTGFFGHPSLERFEIFLNGTFIPNYHRNIMIDLPTTTTGEIFIAISTELIDLWKQYIPEVKDAILQVRYNPTSMITNEMYDFDPFLDVDRKYTCSFIGYYSSPEQAILEPAYHETLTNANCYLNTWDSGHYIQSGLNLNREQYDYVADRCTKSFFTNKRYHFDESDYDGYLRPRTLFGKQDKAIKPVLRLSPTYAIEYRSVVRKIQYDYDYSGSLPPWVLEGFYHEYLHTDD